MAARRDRDHGPKTAAGPSRRRPRPGPAQVQRAAARGPRVALTGDPAGTVLAESRPRIEEDPHPGVTVYRQDAAQRYGRVRVTRHAQRLTAFDDLRCGDPAAAPDQAVRLVVAAPHEGWFGRGHGVHACPADQRGKYRVRMPARHAHPDEVAPRTDHDSPLAVGQQRILGQHVERKLRRGAAARHEPGRAVILAGTHATSSRLAQAGRHLPGRARRSQPASLPDELPPAVSSHGR